MLFFIFILGFIIGMILEYICGNYYIPFFDKCLEIIILIIFFIPFCIYFPLKPLAKGISCETFERYYLNNKNLRFKYKKIGNLIIAFNPKSKKLWNKIYFTRIKKSIDK